MKSRKEAIKEYLECLVKSGYEAAEVVKAKYHSMIANFDTICDTAAILLRAHQIVRERS